MGEYIESEAERNQREWVAEGERLRDLEEDFSVAKAAGTLTDEQRAALACARQAYRQRGEQTGKRAFIGMATIWWWRWLEIGVTHELAARIAYQQLAAGEHPTDYLLQEFDNALIAVTSAAFAIEALYSDIQYLIPPRAWKKEPTQIQRLQHGFLTGWNVAQADDSRLFGRVQRLLRDRADAVHAYTESLPPRPHPAGINTAREHAVFNAVTAGDALDLAIAATALTASEPSPNLPAPHRRWLGRWIAKRAPYHEKVRALADVRRAVPPATAVIP